MPGQPAWTAGTRLVLVSSQPRVNQVEVGAGGTDPQPSLRPVDFSFVWMIVTQGPDQGLPLPQPWGRAGRSQAAALATGESPDALGGLAARPWPPPLLPPALGNPRGLMGQPSKMSIYGGA